MDREQNGRRLTYFRLCAVLLPAVAAMAALTGCRDSEAFRQNIYNQTAPESVDGNMVENEEDNEEQREDIWSVADLDEADKERDYDRSEISQYGEDDDGETNDVLYNPREDTLYTSGNATDPDETSLETGIDTAAGDTAKKGDADISSGSGEGEGDGSSGDGDTTVETVGDGGDTGDGSGSGDGDGDGSGSGDGEDDSTNVDKDAQLAEIPDGTTAAALGDIAVMVQMLGGDGTLVATSADFDTAVVSGVKASAVFSDELSDDLVYLGDIDSFSEITSANFSKLLKAEPDLVFLAEGDSLTSTQKKKLADIGASVIYMDDMTKGDSSKDTAGDHLLYNLEVIAEALGDRSESGGENAADVFADYAEWYDGLLEAAETDRTLYTCYFPYYDDDVTVTISYSYVNRSHAFDGSAIASSGLFLAVGEYAGNAGVETTNTINTNFGWFSKYNQAYLIYFQPYVDWISKKATGGLYESGEIGFFVANGTADSYNNPYPLSKYSNSIYLGNAGYPAVLTGSQYITEKIEDSRDNGGIFSRKYNGSWFQYPISDIITIENTDYEVYTVPYGVTDWTNGCVESPLFTSWISAKFYDTYTDSELIEQIQEFYETFFRCELSDSAAKKILQGREE